MFRIWHRVAIWLVVLVLPLQGLAANAAMRCLMMPDVQTSRAAAAVALPPCHTQMLAEGLALTDEVAATETFSPTTPAPCPHCMACLALGATAWPLAPMLPRLGLSPPVAQPHAEPQRHAVAFVTDGPDRPPRPSQP